MSQILHRHKELLKLEYEYVREEFCRYSDNMETAHKIKAGICRFPVYPGSSSFNSLNQRVLHVRSVGDVDQDDKFEPGKPVCFFTEDASHMVRLLPYVCKVNYVEGNQMVIEVPDEKALSHINESERLGIQLYFDEYTFRLMFDALDKFIAAKDSRMAALRDILLSCAPLHKYNLFPVAFPWINKSQEKAINEILCARDVAIVHGPPGTGKTTTLVEAIYETLRRENQVLVCAPSNMAVDHISEQLIERGISILRVGNPVRISKKLQAHTYERLYEDHPLYPQLWSVRKNIRELYSARKSSGKNNREQIARLKDKVAEFENIIHQDLMQNAKVISCTLTGSGSHLLLGQHFNTVFIDEAAQALTASCLIPLLRSNRIIMAGDHCQLPPTLKCPKISTEDNSISLMEHTIANKPACVSLLTTQYRMHNDIMQFSNREFYHGKLESDPMVSERTLFNFDNAIELVETPDEAEFMEEASANELSRQNTGEAMLALEALKNYFEKIGRERVFDENIDVGIISPYKGQVILLRRLLKQDAYWKPFRKNITIHTIDGFQGQEKDIILISLVRNNRHGNIGFLRELRRMNVALTRARVKLILVGNQRTLCAHPFYQRLYHYVQNISQL